MSNNLPESSSSTVDDGKYKYKKEIDEILREESEFGLAKSMSPDVHLIPNGSDITYSQFKNDMKDKNIKSRTSTLKVNTQELNNQVSTTSKQLCTYNFPYKSHNTKFKQYTPKSISYIKRILETTKDMMPNEDCTDDIVCVFDSSDTKSGFDENVKDINKKENDDVKCVSQQNRHLQNINNIISFTNSSGTSVVGNSSNSNEHKTYSNKRSASDKVGLLKRRCTGPKLNHSHVGHSIENDQVDKTQHRTVCLTVNVNEPLTELKRLSPLQMLNNLQTNEKCMNVLVTEKNNSNLCHNKRQELNSKAGSSQINNENIFTNKTSELSEICPAVDVGIVKLINEKPPSYANLASATQHATFYERVIFSNETYIKLSKNSDSDIFLDSKSPENNRSQSNLVNDSETHKTLLPKGTEKNIKYKLLKNIFKLLLKSDIKDSVTSFLQNDREVQQLLSVNMKKDLMSCKVEEGNNCVSNAITLCTRATQTELSLTSRDQCASRFKWINESCSESEEDLDFNLFL